MRPRERAHLRFPGPVITGKFVHEKDRRTGTGFFVIKIGAVGGLDLEEQVGQGHAAARHVELLVRRDQFVGEQPCRGIGVGKPTHQLAFRQRRRQHGENIIALGDRHAGGRPAARHAGNAGDDLCRIARRKSRMQMHVRKIHDPRR